MSTHHPQRVRIVVADDQALQPQRIQELVAANFEVVATLRQGGEQALSQALWLKPDVVLINIAILQGDCFQFVKRILEELPQTRVVLYKNGSERISEAPEITSSSRELSNREYEVLALLAAGYPMKRVASRLGITYRTVSFHKYKMMEKLGITSTAGLMRYALNRNIMEGFAAAEAL
jgi:DNA-binding NarL/FixJ family response regulator